MQAWYLLHQQPIQCLTARLLQLILLGQVFAARLLGAGLKVELSSDPTALYVRVGAPLARLEEEAERIKFMKQISPACLHAIKRQVQIMSVMHWN